MDIFSNMPQWPTPGTIVSVPVYIFFRHKGIVSDRWYGGKPVVISNSARAGGIAEEPWDVFTSGQLWAAEGHPGNLLPWEVLHRARSLHGTQYNALTWNCESFVNYCHGLPSSSPQLAAIVVAALVGTAIIASRS